jgi:hypothetical protein
MFLKFYLQLIINNIFENFYIIFSNFMIFKYTSKKVKDGS